MIVKAILARKGSEVVTVSPQAKLTDAVELLAARRIGALVVLDGDEHVIGIISERDVVRSLSDHGAAALERRVEEVMTRDVFCCTVSMTMSEMMERMTERRFRHVPVVDGSRLVGIISIGDVVKHRLEEIEQESTAMRDYIMTA